MAKLGLRARLIAMAIVAAVAIGLGVWVWERCVLGNHRIDLYGRICDGGGTPIPDAQVTICVHYVGFWSLPVPLFGGGVDQREEFYGVLSDANGDFEIISAHGYEVDVQAIKKEGFQFESAPDVRVGRMSPVKTWFHYGGLYGRDDNLPSIPERRVTFTLTSTEDKGHQSSATR